MTILSKMTLFYNNQLVNFPCHICGGRVDPNGFDFGLLDEVPDREPRFVCYRCAEMQRPDLIAIQKAGFQFALSGMAQDCVNTGKAVEGTLKMPWIVDSETPAAAPQAATAPLMTDEEYLTEKHAQNLEIECMPIVRALVEKRLEDRQGLSSQDIECLEFYLKNQVAVFRP